MDELRGGLDAGGSDDKAEVPDGFLSKLKLLGVEDYPLVATLGQELADTLEVRGDDCVPQDGVIHTFLVVSEVSNNFVHPLTVTITRGYETLGAGAVTVGAVLSEEGGKVPVLRGNLHTVVSVPGIEHGLPGVGWHSAGTALAQRWQETRGTQYGGSGVGRVY